MAVMVWCQSCKTVVWAYDHQPPGPIAGLFNNMRMPCPKCGTEGNFDGWGSKDAYGDLKERGTKEYPVYDDWSAMKYIAHHNSVEWGPSGDNRWFPESYQDQNGNCPLCGHPQ